MSARTRRHDALDALYAELPTIECAGKCAISCGPILMNATELRRIEAERGAPVPELVTLECPLLERERCSVYAVRPTICRLWGVTEDMLCTFGCTPSRVLSRDEARDFVARAAVIGGHELLGPGIDLLSFDPVRLGELLAERPAVVAAAVRR